MLMRRTVCWWLGLQLCCAAGAFAAPDDDYRRGLQAYERGDVGSAMGLLRAPAAAGHARAQTLLGFLLDHADLPGDAARLYASAAAQGDTEAHAALANLYLSGRGIVKDEKRALQHFSKAAELGHAAAIEIVAEAYLKESPGLAAGARDNGEAVAALRRAAERGHLASAEALLKAGRDGGFGLTPDAGEATRWQARVAELRATRGGAVAKPRP